MNIDWLKIIGATLFELVWVTGLKYAELPWQWGVTALSILGSSYCLITAGNTLPVGTAYSVFVGLSAIGTILVEFLGFGIFPSLTVYDVKGILMKNQEKSVLGGNKK